MNDYEVGYGKPPRATRFSKGRSGNPRGRRKGQMNVATMFLKVAQAVIPVTENGRSRKVPKMEAMMIHLMNKAVGGDIRAIKEVLQWRSVFADAAERNLIDGPDAEKNSIVMKQFIEEIRNASSQQETTPAASLKDSTDDTPID